MFVPGQNQLLANLSLFTVFKDLSIVRFYDFKKNFRGMCFTVQLSKIIFRIAVCLKQLCYYIMLFSTCQEVFQLFLKLFLFLSCSNSDILSHPTGYCQELFLFLFDSFVISARSLRRNSDRIPLYTWFVNSYFHVFYFFANNQNIRFFMSFIPFPPHSPLPVSLPFPAVPDLSHNRNTGPPVASSG